MVPASCTLRFLVTAFLVVAVGPLLALDVPQGHPRLLGDRDELQKLARKRPDDYRRVLQVARNAAADEGPRMISIGLVCAVEDDEEYGREAVELALKYVGGPIKKGHVTFGHDLALCALVYDLCYESWRPEERKAFHQYVNATVDANVDSETHVFHNGWYGYKNWGIGLACYATYHENPRAPEILAALDRDYSTRAATALRLAGDGGGWAEGYYIHYWLYEWLFFCEVTRHCGGPDYFAWAPEFYGDRAIASMFEMYPGIREYGSRRPVPMGDGGGRVFGGDRDKALIARCILVNRYWDDPVLQSIHAFNQSTPRSSVGNFAYMDLLWRDRKLSSADLSEFPLSHLSPGPGYVYARSSWEEDATYFFFKCGDRFTAHQHLDVGHFVIYRHEELAGDGGHYDAFGSPHDVNYHLRTIAHSTILVEDPDETWPGIRAGKVTGNDGGQHHSWPHHNGAVVDAQAWVKDRELYDIADIVAFEDRGTYLYVAGDCTRAYSPKKLELFTRQIVYIRPGTFVVCDRVRSTRPEFRKTWVLQAMKRPEVEGAEYVITSGRGRLFVQPLLPEARDVRLASGDDLYRYGGISYPPSRNTGPAPECRMEVRPTHPSTFDVFLHVLTATDSSAAPPTTASASVTEGEVRVRVGEAELRFLTDSVGGSIEIAGARKTFPKPAGR